MKYVYFTVIILLISNNPLSAQIPGIRVYDESDGYTATIGYTINQDSTGFIWIGSNKGAIQFDGHHFNVFDERNGLKDKEVIHALSCKGGFVFITPLVNALAYYNKGNILNEDQDSLLRQPNNIGMNRLIADQHTGGCWLGDLINQGFLYHFQLGKLEKITIAIKQPFSVLNAHNHWLTLSFKGEIKLYNTLTHCLLPFQLEGDTSVFNSLSQWSFSPNGQYMVGYSQEKRQLVLYIRQNINQLTFIRTFPIKQVPVQIIVDQHNGLWTTYKETGVHFWGSIYKHKIPNEPLALFPSTVINHVFSDRDQNLWFTTKRKGLYFLPTPQWQSYLNALKIGIAPALPTLVGSNGTNHVFLGFENSSRLGVVQKGKYSEFPLSQNMSEGIHALSVKSNLACISSSGGSFNLIKMQSNGLKVQHAFPVYGSIKDIHFQVENNTLYIASNSGAQSISLGQNIQSIPINLFPPTYRCTAILPLQKTVLIGTPNGLYQRTSPGTAFTKVHDNTLQHANITDIAYFNEQTALIGTMADGLYQYHCPSGQTWPIFLNQHQNLGVIHQVFKETQIHYWLATDQGVYSITLNDHHVKQSAHYGFADGLPSNSVSSLCVMHDTLYASTSAGLAVLPIKNTKKPTSHPVVVLKASIQDSIIPFPNELSLSYPVSDLSFTFSAFDFAHLGKIKYRYTLKGHSSQWVTSSTPVANFSDLTPGHYTFLVAAVKPNKPERTPLTQISLTVYPAFWQTTWFKSLCLVLLILLSGGVLHYILKKKREKAFLKLKQKRKLAELELEAIKAQINPHFIGNCLNSIQYLAYQNNYKSVGLYLDHFSSLIRQTMALSQRMFTPLQNELEYLTNYLELEKMRFKERLHYSIHVEEGVSKMCLLPAMLLQPYVENSLKHGGLHQGEQGKVVIEIGKLANGWLKVCITDNGSGIEKEAFSGTHQKLGLRLSGSRVKTYNELFHLGIKLRISPLPKLTGNNEQGTIVELIIPPINHENTYV